MRAWGTGLGGRLEADLTAFADLHIALDGASRGVRTAVAAVNLCGAGHNKAAARRAPRAAARARRLSWRDDVEVWPHMRFAMISVTMCAVPWFSFLARKWLRIRNRKTARLFGLAARANVAHMRATR